MKGNAISCLASFWAKPGFFLSRWLWKKIR